MPINFYDNFSSDMEWAIALSSNIIIKLLTNINRNDRIG